MITVNKCLVIVHTAPKHPSKIRPEVNIKMVVISLLIHLPSSRQEYRPWTGVRPAKSARRNPPTQYSSPGTEATHVPCETSYQAAYSGEAQRSTGLLQGETIIPSASTNIQPAVVPQPIPAALQAGTSVSPPGLQQSILPERTELSGAAKAEVGTRATLIPAAKQPVQCTSPNRLWGH